MDPLLSNGLPWLAVANRDIVVYATQQPLLLRGVNRSGLEYAEPGDHGFLTAAGISEHEILHIAGNWMANIVRIPFNQDWALSGRGTFSAADYLEAVDQVIFWASAAGAYTLLDLQWLDADAVHGLNSNGSPNRVPPLPTTDSIEVWSRIARRYRDEPAVLFDIFTEPHDPLPDDPAALEGIDESGATYPLPERRVSMAEWQPWARHLVLAIRRVHPASMIFVSGVGWAYDLRGMPLTVAKGSSEVFGNLVYSTHVYPWSGTPVGTPSFATAGALTWKEAFGRLARRAPVFVAEWGGEPEHVEWGDALAQYAARLGIGWTAWSWSDWPRLVVDAQARRYDLTEFGRMVRRHLRKDI